MLDVLNSNFSHYTVFWIYLYFVKIRWISSLCSARRSVIEQEVEFSALVIFAYSNYVLNDA